MDYRTDTKTDESGNAENRYLHGPAIDMILADEDATGEVLWAATDHLGSVTHLLDFDGTSDTDVVATFTYDAFGIVVDQTGTGVQFIYGWTGREVDAESDEQYNRARYYDADIGRWLSQDPISFAAGDENLYRYVGNAVTTFTDPMGLDEVRTYWFSDRVTWIPERQRVFWFEPDDRGFDIGRYAEDGETIILDNGAHVSLPDLREVANELNSGGGKRGMSRDAVDAARKKEALDRFKDAIPSGRTDGFAPLEFGYGVSVCGYNFVSGIGQLLTDPLGTAENAGEFFGRPYPEVERDVTNGLSNYFDEKTDTWRGTGELTAELASNFLPTGIADDARHLRHLKKLPEAPREITTSYGRYVRRADEFKHALDPDHVRAAAREKAGEVVKLKPDGVTPYDHLTETRADMRGAKRHIIHLRKHLNDNRLCPSDRAIIEAELGELSGWLDRAENILGELAQ